MDPLTHTLLGANLAATRLGATTRLAGAALVIGANLPDVDAVTYFLGDDAALGLRRGWTHGVLALAVLPSPALPQPARAEDGQREDSRVETALQFLGGAAAALGAHEASHLAFDVLFDADPGVKGVRFAGVPFFAITHGSVSRRREFTISSAGFWTQHAISEWLPAQEGFRLANADPVTGQAAWYDLRVRIEKAAPMEAGETAPRPAALRAPPDMPAAPELVRYNART